MSAYQEAGFNSRREYLDDLAQSYPRRLVYELASILGPNEDFDGLVTSLEDAEDEGWCDDE